MSEHEHVHDFVHLHLHTEYSLLDGFARIDRAVKYAKELNMRALAITDHGTMFGVIDFYKACKAAGIHPVIGVESYLAKRGMKDRDPQFDSKPYHMLLLAKNNEGYKNLLKLTSAAQLEGYYYRPRIDRELLAKHSKGIIATSGCLAAEIPQMVEKGRDDEARKLIGWYQDVFGPENFYLELQAHDIPELETLNKWLIENSKYANVPLVATNDVHYVRYEDYDPHDTLLCIQTSSAKTDTNRLKMTDNSYHLRTQAEMWKLFGAYPDVLNNTLLIAEQCQDLHLDHKEYHLPVFPVPPRFSSADDYLRHLCLLGMAWRFGERVYDDPVYTSRLDHELKIIHDLGFDTYFLIVWDLCEFARHADIWWNVRGSGAGSLVAYSLGITNLDPLENGLIFERFLNPGRVSMPDFDLDFPEDRRAEMIEYCARKYGQDKVAAIITFGTLGAKAAIRDVGRALEVPLTEVDRIARVVPAVAKPPKITEMLGDDPEKAVPDLKAIYQSDAQARKIIDTAIAIEGVPRHASTHAAGIIVADKPLDEYLPLHRPTKGDAEDSPVKRVTQFPMETAEAIGLLKIDFLGLSTLTILRRACDLIEQQHGIKFDMSNIPYKPDPDDPAITRKVEESFEMIGRGDTVGVFQIESAGMRQMLTGMQPKTFEHIIAAISLYRPGPMDYIPVFNRRLHGEEAVIYHHEKLIPIVGNTYGICVYQEQIMQIAADLFGYTLGDADLMRRAVSKKKEKDLMQHRQIFIEKGPNFGVNEEAAIKIFDDIAEFARYGFNKCLVSSTEILDTATGRLVRMGDLASGQVQISETLTLDTDTLQLKPGKVTAVMENGVKPVYRVKTQLGRQIDATANHPFYTFDGWRMLGELAVGDHLAVPREIPFEGTREWEPEAVIELAQTLLTGEVTELPDEVFELANNQLNLLLETVWEKMSFVTSSSKLARQLQHLCLRLGTLALLRQVESPLGGEFYELEIQENLPSEGDVYWDKIVSIEYVGEEPTYDLTIEGTHNFVANDIVVHNSHAADYAVITCQTAYLKCHYPHEYMSALMSVYYDDSSKVSLFIADCRRMGIDVLPPHVNRSQADFGIEEWDDGSRHVRFGLGAIKNLGLGAIEFLLGCREEEAFKDLDDFLKRCDMRALGKRGLESLIKAGAMDEFGDRAVMLANLERLMSSSGEHHKNAAVGQVSMFDLMGGRASGGGSEAVLQTLTDKPPAEWDRREQLRWEKELLGLYISEHPLTTYWPQIQKAVTHTTAELNEERDYIAGRRVTIAGLINEIRTITTKKGDSMAVLTVEDIQGTIEVVLFPRTWRDHREKLELDKVYRIFGEADLRGTDVQIKADTLDQNFEVSEAADDRLPLPPRSLFADSEMDEETGATLYLVPEPVAVLESVVAPATAGATQYHMRLQQVEVPAEVTLEEPPGWWDSTRAEYEDEEVQIQVTMVAVTPESEPEPTIIPEAIEPRLLVIVMERTNDSGKDRRRLATIHGVVQQYSGKDSFCIEYTRRGGGRTRMKFPEVPIHIHAELMAELEQLPGVKEVKIGI